MTTASLVAFLKNIISAYKKNLINNYSNYFKTAIKVALSPQKKLKIVDVDNDQGYILHMNLVIANAGRSLTINIIIFSVKTVNNNDINNI